ncbi:MAG: hypothetical protein DRG78_03265 [Epsilonproteobacteria bacterium]|nr:MAG: hypothetical protein DRG78_03265 [Campylobacterota bacterium]
MIDKKNISFNIPIYQRPYAWSTKEVEVLLIDFYNAYKENRDKYYIGNIVTFPNNDKQDIVDGQQRFTTLFLIGVISNWKSNIELDYEIRENDRKFLKTINSNFNGKHQYQNINNNLIENLKFIKTFFEDKENHQDFKEWIYNSVKFVLTKLTNNIDVNKYFEVMNNRGIQLEKHHILKANLLKNIDDSDKKKYAKIWDYCSDMNVYLEEYILKDEENEDKIKEVRKSLLINPLDKFNEYNTISENVFDILVKNKETIDSDAKAETKKQFYKSIVCFETFLLHIYKITVDNTIKINDSDLLEIIKLDKVNAKKFIEDILTYRVLFDYFVFKRNKEHKSYLRLITNNGEIQSNNSSLLMIELLFEITSTKFNLWLTSFLRFVKKEKEIFNLVQNLEDADIRVFEDKLNQGTATPHYWFYKLDYLLWKHYNWNDIEILENFNIKEYRLKNLSSIEHIQPQNPKEECNKWEEFDIDNFGNLALISNHMNSKLSNQCFKSKKKDIEKQISNNTVESLKMLLVYSKYNQWNAKNCETHQFEMIEILNKSKCINIK